MSDLDNSPDEPPVSGVVVEEENLGLAGKTAKFFINSPLSPLLYITMLLLGLAGLVMTPRQEDPQISVPMVDLFVQYPGASSDQVASLAIQPLERVMWGIQGVKHVYSATERGQGIVTVEFDVGEEMESSLVKVNDKLASNMDKIPSGVSPPLIKAKGIDDVPAVTITLWSDKDYDGDGVPDVDDSQLRRLALSVLQSIKEIPDTGEGFVVGGRAEQVTIEVLPERLSGYGLSLGQVAQAIQQANAEQLVGNVESSGTQLTVVTGKFLQTVDDINGLQVGSHNGQPVYMYDVAEVRQGPEDAKHLVAYSTGAASALEKQAESAPAVTIAIAKKKGSNGVSVARQVLDRVEELKGRLIPGNVEVSITRNYGESADAKVKALIFKLFVATGFVFLLVWYAFRALKPAFVVLLVIPVVLLFTIFAAWMMGFTIDRVSLFALIFSIGILVDDAIVVVENVYRRWLETGRTDAKTAIDAVREVGNPTILATFTVIGALLPMGFVSGMMGPYMMPIPALGTAAMFISLFAAFVFTPWLAIHPVFRPSMQYLEKAEKREHAEAEKLDGIFRGILTPMIEDRRKARRFKLIMWSVFLLTCSLFYFELVVVKMLPLDNKPEFSVVVDLPEGTALPETANRANQIANLVRKMPEVTAVQVYVGTAKPYDFNGMVRHYYLRNQPWQAEVQVELLDKGDRKRSSHEIAVDARQQLVELLKGVKLNFSVVEMPPGPPVLQSVVADVHGPDKKTRKTVAERLTRVFEQAPNLVDVDNYMRAPYDYWHFIVDREKSDRRGISVESINKNLAMALGGMVLGDVKQKAGYEPVNILIQVPLAERSQISRLSDILVQSGQGSSVPLRELGHFERMLEDDIIYHKDLRPVEYVVADVGGRLAAPVYGMMQVEDLLAKDADGRPFITPDNVHLGEETYWTSAPSTDIRSGLEWTGEWTVTYETFRDMGAAFGAALILIYILVVWEFGNFRVPALIMSPIPLTLLGIIPMHGIFFALGWGGEFTATSMIGWIALAGIIVRNSILLVDFAVHEIQHGATVEEAVIKSCKTRTRPILITAFALIFASSVIFFDPIFQGMAISLASGVLISTILTLIVIPLGCVQAADSLCEVAGVRCAERKQDNASGTAAAGKPVWVKIWSLAVAIIIIPIKILSSLVITIIGLIRKAKSVQKKHVPVTSAVVTRDVSVAPRQASQENAPVKSDTSVVPAVTEAAGKPATKPNVVTGKKVAADTSKRKKTAKAQKKKTAKAQKKKVPKPSAPVAEEAPTAAKPASPENASPKPDAIAAPVVGRPANEPTAKPKTAASTKKKATRKKAVAKKAAPTKSKVTRKVGTKKKAAAKPVSKKVAKKASGRRGIRLKSMHDSSDDGLS
jgi:multidrug efflux pump subunit AcrB